jgi:cellulose synthase/poly-beta-1,6-N-acetylglucosamine synthase-like glycosyltransferase
VTSALLLLSLSILAVVAIWLGYPALMLAFARLVPRANRPSFPSDTSAWPRMTVVLATRESSDVIHARVHNLLESVYPADRFDVIVTLDAAGAACTPEQLQGTFTHADGRPADNVRVIVGDLPGGKACSLNAAVRLAAGDVLLMVDSKQYFTPDTAKLLAAALGDERFGAVSGALTLGGNGRSPMHIYWALEKRLRHAESMVHSAIGVTGAVYVVRRALWPELPIGTILDDVYVPMALVLQGHRVGFRPDAHAYDVRTFSASAELTRKVRTLTGVFQVCRLLPGILVPWRNPVWGQFVAHKLLRLATPLFLLTGVVAGCWWLVALLRERPTITLAGLGITTTVVLLVSPLRTVVLGVVRWTAAMQFAVVKGVLNGVRGRWAVWSRSRL